jgi:hypothetical protein
LLSNHFDQRIIKALTKELCGSQLPGPDDEDSQLAEVRDHLNDDRKPRTTGQELVKDEPVLGLLLLKPPPMRGYHEPK